MGFVDDETIINDCEKWIFFGDTLSKGKKNDHVFHNACQTYIIKYYDKIRIDSGLPAIPFNITWTDSCPIQYRCRQNFLNTVSAASHHTHKPIITHKFTQKYRFKGSWDATGKIVKQQILQNELKYDRCATALECYKKLTCDLSKDGDDKRTNKLLEYERTGDARMLLNSVYTTQKTHIGYGTESKIEYDTMTNKNEYKHVVFTDRENIPDMKAVTGTMLISEIHGNRDVSQSKIISARLPYVCPPCRNNVMDAQVKCEYKKYKAYKGTVDYAE